MFQLVFTRIPKKQLGLWTGIASVIVSLAPALGPTYGGVLTSVWSWRGIFVGILPVIACATVLGAASLHDKRTATASDQFDFIGLVLLGLTFTSLVYAFNIASIHGFISSTFALSSAITAILIATMTWYARNGSRQLFDYRILRNGIVRQRLMQYCGLQLINIGLSFVLPLFAQNVLHATPMIAGMMLLPGALVGAIIAPIAGKVYDRFGPTWLLIVSAAFATTALTLFALFTNRFTVVLIALLYIILRIGFNSGFGTAVSDANMHVAYNQRADQNSMFSMMQQFAGSLGTSIMSAVIAAAALHSKTKNATIHGSQCDFLILLIVALIILASAMVVAKKARN